MKFCPVELCRSKCRPRRTITPDVLRRVTVSPRALPWAPCLALARCTAVLLLAVLSGTPPIVSIASCDLLSVSTSLVQDTRLLQRCPHGPASGTHIAWFRSETLSLALFKNWTVLNCFCLDCTQFHPRSLDNVALNESKIFQYF